MISQCRSLARRAMHTLAGAGIVFLIVPFAVFTPTTVYADENPASSIVTARAYYEKLAADCDPASGDYADCLLFAAMVANVIIYDIAFIVGLIPFPPTSKPAEITEYLTNITLKFFPARLRAPRNLQVDPLDGPGPGYSVDPCGIDFRLLSAEGGYENFFGVLNVKDPYIQLRPFEFYRWGGTIFDGDDPNATTRWGFLRAPWVYHANTPVEVSIHTPYEVQRFDNATQTLGEPYSPINTFAEEPQQVYLPIGQHTIQWHAATNLDIAGDIIVPPILVLAGLLSEKVFAKGGTKAAKQVRRAGISDEAAEEALDPRGAKRLSEGVEKFHKIWQDAFYDRRARKAKNLFQAAAEKAAKERQAKIRKKLKKSVKKILIKILVELAKVGFSTIHSNSSAEARETHGPLVAAVLDSTWSVYHGQVRPDQDGISIQEIIATIDAQVMPIARRIIENYGPAVILDLLRIETQRTVRNQTITVWDSTPPTIIIDPTPIVVEATDFGGTRLSRIINQLTEQVYPGSRDNCGRTPILSVDAPSLLKLGDHQLTWTARDRGPNPNDGQDYAPTAVQNILVQDTQPPLLLAPPSKVILSTSEVLQADAEIGAAVAIDLVDVQPILEHDAPAAFPVDTRTSVTWTATDTSGNAAQASQLITVKETNTAPTANDASASTLTAQPVDIRLTANDPDELGGRFDPLWFKIESAPQKGEFIAPLFPFFIEDYRTRPHDGLGPDFMPVDDEPMDTQVESFIQQKFCAASPQQEPPRNFVHNARFVHVTDDGTHYLLDEFFRCQAFEDSLDNNGLRFSKWDPEGEFLGQIAIAAGTPEPRNDAFRLDRDGFLYFASRSSEGSSSEMRLWRCPTDWTITPSRTTSDRCTDAYKIENSSHPDGALDVARMADARIDSRLNIAYIVDNQSIFAFELLDSGGTRYITELGPKDDQGSVLQTWFGQVPMLEVGADGALYANDTGLHRIHKISPMTIDENGDFQPGDYVGWSGKCTDSGNNACLIEDLTKPELGHSRGYSCTYESDSCTVNPTEASGAEQGQFNVPRFISLDPNDILYIADFENSRVQRLAPDGTFAGEAKSTGTGFNQGDQPSFILGNMGKPASVSVNSTQFYVVDRIEKFVHIFGTLPFKEMTDNTATVTYVSDQDFPNPNVMGDDTFSFSVTDGLERSNIAMVSVTVGRNFRPPEALSETIITAEDTPLDFALPARDPDGIIGKDFLGLDTLTYSLTGWPENGTLSGYGENWTYTPLPDFFGDDSIRFRVNDGLADSDEATLTIRVTPVNDPPVITLEQPERVPLGFPMLLESVFTDDRTQNPSNESDQSSSDGYEGNVDWGDGSTDTTGDFVMQGDTVNTSGVIVIAPADAESEGILAAQHTYEQPGLKTVMACVTDSDGLQGCTETEIDVQPMAVLGAGARFYDDSVQDEDESLDDIADGAVFTAEFMLVNGQPSVGDGVAAEGVELNLLFPDDLLITDIAIDQGTCTRSDRGVSCDIGTLNPGAVATLTMLASGPGLLIYDEFRDFQGTLSTSSEALDPDLGVAASIGLLADTTDSDGDGMSDIFETTYGFNPAIDDSAGDSDGDGLSNVDEYNEGTSPETADTDGDGQPDGVEVAAGSDPTIDDIPPMLNVPNDILTSATGALTHVNIGLATADDGKDGPVKVYSNNNGPFRPGHNVVTWSAFDEAGNSSEGYQFVKIVPMVSFEVDQTVSEGTAARARVHLNGPAVDYPVIVPFSVGGTAVNPSDHDAISGEAVIKSGLSTDIEIGIVRDAADEPDETITLTMGAPTNAVPGAIGTHSIIITEINQPPKVMIAVEQQGRATTTVVSGAGLIGIISEVRDDPAQEHTFDWSGSDSALIDPVAVNDPAYLLDPSGLAGGLYGMHVSIVDDGAPQQSAAASSLLNVANKQLILKSADDSDGDGVSDAAEGPGDADGDRIADYLDDVSATNMLRLAADGRLLETAPGLTLRLGATAFGNGSALAALVEQDFGIDVEFGYASDVLDFEIVRLDAGASAQVVIPLAHPVSVGATYRQYVNGQWQDFITDLVDNIASAPGVSGACPPPSNSAYQPGMAASDGCLQLTLTDGGPNDIDGIADGVIRTIGGLAAPVAVNVEDLPQTSTVVVDSGEAVMVRLRLHSDSGDALFNSLTLEASGDADDLMIDDVFLVHDANRDGEWDDDEAILANGQFTVDNGTLTLSLTEPLQLPAGNTDLLVVYVFGIE